MYLQKVLFIGGSGTMGRYILHGLHSTGIQIRAMVRNPQSALGLLPSGIEILKGDIQRVADLEKAFDGIDSLFINLSSLEQVADKHWQPLNQGLSTLLVFARMNSIRHVLFHSTLASHTGPLQKSGLKMPALHRMAERYLMNCGIPFTIFRTSIFMENFYHRFRSGNQIRISEGLSNPLYWLSAFELGKMVSQSICNPQMVNQVFSIQGKKAIGLEEAARLFVKLYKDETLEVKSSDGNMQRFFTMLRPKKLEEALWMRLITENSERLESQKTRELMGEPQFDFQRFVQEVKPRLTLNKDLLSKNRLKLVD